MKALILFAFLLGSFTANAKAAVLEFEAEQTLWYCPVGAIYIPLECKEGSRIVEKKSVAMDVDQDGFAFGYWEATTEASVHTMVIASKFVNVEDGPLLSLLITVGFDEDYKRNTQLLNEMDPAHPAKTIYLVGERKTVGTLEFVPTLALTHLKFIN